MTNRVGFQYLQSRVQFLAGWRSRAYLSCGENFGGCGVAVDVPHFGQVCFSV